MFDPSVGKILWKRECQPTLVFLPGEFHGQRSLAGYSPLGHSWATNTSFPTKQFAKLLTFYIKIILKWIKWLSILPFVDIKDPLSFTCSHDLKHCLYNYCKVYETLVEWKVHLKIFYQLMWNTPVILQMFKSCNNVIYLDSVNYCSYNISITLQRNWKWFCGLLWWYSG